MISAAEGIRSMPRIPPGIFTSTFVLAVGIRAASRVRKSGRSWLPLVS
jgi:hypothetical protein